MSYGFQTVYNQGGQDLMTARECIPRAAGARLYHRRVEKVGRLVDGVRSAPVPKHDGCSSTLFNLGLCAAIERGEPERAVDVHDDDYCAYSHFAGAWNDVGKVRVRLGDIEMHGG